jgi:hypothetical protein
LYGHIKKVDQFWSFWIDISSFQKSWLLISGEHFLVYMSRNVVCWKPSRSRPGQTLQASSLNRKKGMVWVRSNVVPGSRNLDTWHMYTRHVTKIKHQTGRDWTNWWKPALEKYRYSYRHV